MALRRERNRVLRELGAAKNLEFRRSFPGRRLSVVTLEDVQATLTRHEEAGTTDTPEYQQAMLVFYARHVCRLPEWPEAVARSCWRSS